MDVQQLVQQNEELSRTVERLQQQQHDASQGPMLSLKTWDPVRDQAIDVSATTLSDGSVGTPVQLLHAWQLRLASLVSTYDRLCNDTNASTTESQSNHAPADALQGQGRDPTDSRALLSVEEVAIPDDSAAFYQGVLEEMLQSSPRSCRSGNDLGWHASPAEVLHEVDCQSRECLRLLAYLALADPVLLASTLQALSPEQNLDAAKSFEMYRALAGRIKLKDVQVMRLRQLLAGSNSSTAVNVTATQSLELHPAPAALKSLPADSFHSMFMSLARHQAGLETVQQQCRKLVNTAVGVPLAALLRIFSPLQRAIYLSGIPFALPDWSVLLSFLLDDSKEPSSIDALNAAGLGMMRKTAQQTPTGSPPNAGFTFQAPVPAASQLPSSYDGERSPHTPTRALKRESHSGSAGGVETSAGAQVVDTNGSRLKPIKSSASLHQTGSSGAPDALEGQANGVSLPTNSIRAQGDALLQGIPEAQDAFNSMTVETSFPGAPLESEMWMGSPVFSEVAHPFNGPTAPSMLFHDSKHFNVGVSSGMHAPACASAPLPFTSSPFDAPSPQLTPHALDAGSALPFSASASPQQLSGRLEPLGDGLSGVGMAPIAQSTQHLDVLHQDLQSLLTSAADDPPTSRTDAPDWQMPFPGSESAPLNFSMMPPSPLDQQDPSGSYETNDGESNSKRLRSCFMATGDADMAGNDMEVDSHTRLGTAPCVRRGLSVKWTTPREPSVPRDTANPYYASSQGGKSVPLIDAHAVDVPGGAFHPLEVTDPTYGDLLDVFRAGSSPPALDQSSTPPLPPDQLEQLQRLGVNVKPERRGRGSYPEAASQSFTRSNTSDPFQQRRTPSSRASQLSPSARHPSQPLSEVSRTRQIFSRLDVAGRERHMSHGGNEVAHSPQSAPLALFWDNDAKDDHFSFDVNVATPLSVHSQQHNASSWTSLAGNSSADITQHAAEAEQAREMFEASTHRMSSLGGPSDQSLLHYLHSGEVLPGMQMPSALSPSSLKGGVPGSERLPPAAGGLTLDMMLTEHAAYGANGLAGVQFHPAANGMEGVAQAADGHTASYRESRRASHGLRGDVHGGRDEAAPHLFASLAAPRQAAPPVGFVAEQECVFMSEG